MSAFVTSDMFRVFVNTLTPDDQYLGRNMQIFWQQFQTTLSQKGKIFLSIFDCVSELWMKFTTFWKPRRVS